VTFKRAGARSNDGAARILLRGGHGSLPRDPLARLGAPHWRGHPRNASRVTVKPTTEGIIVRTATTAWPALVAFGPVADLLHIFAAGGTSASVCVQLISRELGSQASLKRGLVNQNSDRNN
jgi:hypothetical protein